MKTVYLKESLLTEWIERLMAEYPVIAPVAKKSRFVFAKLKKAGDLRLDYDTTILPPKRAFFPPKQDLIRFMGNSVHGCLDPREKILFGVHPYDIKAIGMLDLLFEETYPDHNYLANRRATIIVGSNVQKHYKNAFFGSINRDMPLQGHDLFLTRIDGGYTIDVLTEKGGELLKFGTFEPATEAQIRQAADANQKAEDNCPEKLEHESKDIRAKIEASWDSPQWEEASKDCFSCGSCNIVCPTCYCFDVQDEWHIDQKSGKRYRRWDACLTSEFAEVSVQGGTENFRKTRAARYRHRFLRKAAYLNDKLGGPACVGCGRCSGACTVDIANPAKFLNQLIKA